MRLRARGVAVIVVMVTAGCSRTAGSAEAATLVVRADRSAECNVELAVPDLHGRVWYSKATVSPEEHPAGEIPGELRFETDETAVFSGGGVQVWFGSYEYVEITSEPGARGTKYPAADCPITARSDQWRPPEGGV